MACEPVRAAIFYALECFNYEDAVFLAERLHAEVATTETTHLLATCYYRSGRVRQARHLLAGCRAAGSPKCELLYARCCLDLQDYQAGLLALKGLLCLEDTSSDDIAAHFGADAGVAFWLLGELNRRLHLRREAARHFHSCLHHNPFLWTAFQALCELGEKPSPESIFSVANFPQYLRSSSSHLPPPPSTGPSSPSTHPPTVTDAPARESKTGPRRSAFTPVPPPKPACVTPNLFNQSAMNVGKAVASSTPFPRTLPFTSAPLPLTPEGGGGDVEGGGARLPALRGLRQQLQFGSAASSATSMREWGGAGGVATPYTPSFGVLPVPPSSLMHTLPPPPPRQALDFSTITPSPSTLSPHHYQLLQSAPKSQKCWRQAAPSSREESQPRPPPRPLLFDSPPADSQSGPVTSQPANEMGLLQSHDHSPPGGATPTMPLPRAPVKSEVVPRRSARLSGAGKSERSLANLRRRVDLAPSSLTVHTARAKSRLKAPSGRRITDKKAALVTFHTPATSRESEPAGPSQFPRPSLEQGTGSVGGCVLGVAQLGGAVKHELEQGAMSSIRSLLALLSQLGAAYRALFSYSLVAAVGHLRALPPHQCHTPWALALLARCYFAGERFKESVKLYEEVHEMDPHRQEGMELYASALWHVQKEVELSVLAEELRASAPLRPQGLCAMASLLNLQKDHQGALKCLHRATQVEPLFTYAYVLQGHEYWLLKDYEKSLASFQAAVTIDPDSTMPGMVWPMSAMHRSATCLQQPTPRGHLTSTGAALWLAHSLLWLSFVRISLRAPLPPSPWQSLSTVVTPSHASTGPRSSRRWVGWRRL